AKVDKEKCTECKTCVDVCPSAAIHVNGSGTKLAGSPPRIAGRRAKGSGPVMGDRRVRGGNLSFLS
ncbi:MAG: 4Fe-4S binding protein, partial [Methanomicrobiales archaeon]|nr:4Fe-4S binding protein [Methanomicrobiales archaeon]